MKRTLRFAPLALGLLFAASAHAQDLPNFDKSLVAPAAEPPSGNAWQSAEGSVSSWDEQRGVPAFFWAEASAASAFGATIKSRSPRSARGRT